MLRMVTFFDVWSSLASRNQSGQIGPDWSGPNLAILTDIVIWSNLAVPNLVPTGGPHSLKYPSLAFGGAAGALRAPGLEDFRGNGPPYGTRFGTARLDLIGTSSQLPRLGPTNWGRIDFDYPARP